MLPLQPLLLLAAATTIAAIPFLQLPHTVISTTIFWNTLSKTQTVHRTTTTDSAAVPVVTVTLQPQQPTTGASIVTVTQPPSIPVVTVTLPSASEPESDVFTIFDTTVTTTISSGVLTVWLSTPTVTVTAPGR